MNTRKSVLLATLATWGVLGFWANTGIAGSITAELSDTEIEISEPAQLQLTIEGSIDGDIEVPVVDGLLFEQAGRSTQMNFVNGKFSHTLTLVYLIRAQKTGNLTIPSIKVEIDGKSEATLPLTLTIKGQGSGSQAQQGQAQPQTRGQTQGQQGQSQAVKQAGGVFLERECNKKDPYVGEQIICYVRIYHRNNIYSGQRQGDVGTDFRRFSVEGERKYVRQLEGVSYGVIELREVIVPLKAGKSVLPAAGLLARIAVPGKRDKSMDRLMDQFRGGLFRMDPFMNNEQEVVLESNSLEIDVKPLPETGKPPSFTGVVGDVTMSALVSARNIKAGENVTITIEIAGKSVLDTMPDPTITFPDIGKIYNDKPEYTEQINPDQGVASKKVFKIALVPVKPGSHNLGTWEFSYFNPETASWQTLSSELGTIVVEASQAEAQGLTPDTLAEQGPKSVKVLGQDMIGPHRNVNVENKQSLTLSERWLYFAGGAVPLGASLLFVGSSLMLGRRSENNELSRRSRALKASEKIAQEVKKKLDQGEAIQASDVAMVLKQYIGDKASRQASALTSTDITELISKHGTDEQVVRSKAIMQTAERLEYGGNDTNKEVLSTLLKDSNDLVRALDRSWKGRL
jgi:hypothetical protein